jgi:transposase
MVRRYGWRDDQWEQIKHVRPGRADTVGVPAKDHRLFVEAVRSRSRAGMPWRDVPERFGDWKNMHRRPRRWSDGGVWHRVFPHLAGDAAKEYAMIDSTIVRAHQHTAGAKGGPRQQSASGVATGD